MDADREEKLRAAKEKLKKFQQRQQRADATPSPAREPAPLAAPAAAAPEEPVNTVSNYFASSGPDSKPVFGAGPESAFQSIVPNPEVQDHIPITAEQPNQEISELDTSDKLSSNTVPAAWESEKQSLLERLEHHEKSLRQYEEYCQSLNGQLLSVQQSQAVGRAERERELEDAVQRLTKDLQSHKDSLQITVTERTDLQASLQRMESALTQKDDEVTSLHSRLEGMTLKLSESRAHNVEEVARESRQENARLQTEFAELQTALFNQQMVSSERKDEISELQSRLSKKESEVSELNDRLREQASKLELAEVNLCQLRSAHQQEQQQPSCDDDRLQQYEEQLKEKEESLAVLAKEVQEHKTRESELTSYIQQTSHDREQIIQQYTAYSQQLTAQIETLTQQVNEKVAENQQLLERENGLRAHMEQLEQQLQTQLQKKTAGEEKKDDDSENQRLKATIEELTNSLSSTKNDLERIRGEASNKDQEMDTLKLALVAKDAQLSDMETQFDILKSQTSNATQNEELVADCESAKVAAARAMKQNQEMKEQLFELDDAVTKLTNNKVDLTNELESVKRKLINEEELQQDLKNTKSTLEDREKAISQLQDQMKYYVAFAENSISGNSHPDEMIRIKERAQDLEETLKRVTEELRLAKEEIETLNSHNLELRSQLEILSTQSRDDAQTPSSSASDSLETPTNMTQLATPSGNAASCSSSVSTSSIGSSIEIVGDEMVNKSRFSGSSNHVKPAVSSSVSDASNTNSRASSVAPSSNFNSVPVISTDVAFLKLEQKFNAAMERIAELSTEKEQLEHVNVQLQEETETVGEYITLYQYQRKQIKQRMEEKELQLQQVSREREDLKSKLQQLQTLVTNFMETKKQNVSPEITQEDGSKDTPEYAYTEGKVNGTSEDVEGSSPSDLAPSTPPTRSPAGPVPPEQTADQILALFSEIGSNQVLQQDFHPWFFFWENNTGKMMTV